MSADSGKGRFPEPVRQGAGRDLATVRVGESVLQRLGRSVPPTCASLVTIAGVGVLAVHLVGPGELGIPRNLLDGVSPLVVVLLLCGAESLWLQVGRQPSTLQRWLAWLMGVVLVAVPAFRMWLYGNEGLYLDLLGQLVGWPSAAWRQLYALTPDAQACFGLLGLGLLAIDSKLVRPIAQWIALLLGLCALAGFVAQAYALIMRTPTVPFELMVLPVSAAFILLSVGLLYARPQRSFARVMLSDTAGGESARWLLPAAVLIPVLIGALALEAQRVGYLTPAASAVFLVMSLILLFVAMIWWNSSLLYRADMQRETIRERLHYDSLHDALTGLANRAHFLQRLELEARRAREYHVPCGVLYMDLDRFKQVNDTMGHPAGDVLLKSVAGRLAGCVRSRDLCARLGGDEFVVLLTDSEAVRVYEVARRILDTVSELYSLDGRDVTVGVSIGVALGSGTTESAEMLLKAADVALYEAKRSGKGCIHPPPPERPA